MAGKWTSPEKETLVLELVRAGKGTSPEGEVLELSVDPVDSRQGPTQDSAVHQSCAAWVELVPGAQCGSSSVYVCQ